MPEFIKTAGKITLCLLLSIVAGCIAMLSVYMLPITEMRANIARSSELFDYEGIYPQWANGYKSTQLDNWTESYVLSSAIYPVEHPLKEAMNVPIIEYKDTRLTLSLTLQANGVGGDTTVRSYGRYWHGSLVFLKPLLLFFDVSDIRLMNMILQAGMLLAIVIKMADRGLKQYLLHFFVAIIIINPVTMPMSFTFSTEYLLMLSGCLVLLHMHDRLCTGKRYFFYFLFMGILTSFFNELSFPLITLGIPMFLYLLLEKEKDIWKNTFKKELIYIIMWGMGYSVMWVGKWICAWFFTGCNYLTEAARQAQLYTESGREETPTLLDRLWKNISVLAKWPFVLLIVIAVILVVAYSFKHRAVINRNTLCTKLPFIILALLPFAMYVALGNGYSYHHYWFSYRQLAVTAAAGLCILTIEPSLEQKADEPRSN